MQRFMIFKELFGNMFLPNSWTDQSYFFRIRQNDSAPDGSNSATLFLIKKSNTVHAGTCVNTIYIHIRLDKRINCFHHLHTTALLASLLSLLVALNHYVYEPSSMTCLSYLNPVMPASGYTSLPHPHPASPHIRSGFPKPLFIIIYF